MHIHVKGHQNLITSHHLRKMPGVLDMGSNPAKGDMRDVIFLYSLVSHALPTKEGESLVHFIMCMTSRVDTR